VILKADVEISSGHSQKISWELFYSSILDFDPEFIKQLYDYQHALGASAIFIPRIFTFQCTVCP